MEVSIVKAYLFKITLKGSYPMIWRKVIVPSNISFKSLHDTIQLAMGWSNTHLYRFQFKDLNLIISSSEEKSVANNAINNVTVKRTEKTDINGYFETCDDFTYIYDFDDWWEHKIEPIEKLNNYNYPYPQVINAKGYCPPERCGGIYGYYDFLEILKDENHPKHKEVLKWSYDQNYTAYDMDETNVLMKKFLVFGVKEEFISVS